MRFLFFLFICSMTVAVRGQSILGSIIDAESGQCLPHASIWVAESGLGVVSGADGRFSLPLASSGKYTLHCSFLGYATLQQEVNLGAEDLDLGLLGLAPVSREWGSAVVVTAQREGRDHLRVPEAVSVLMAKQIEQNGARSMAEALIGLPGVWMQKTNHGGGSPFVRGLTGNQTLLLLDGIRLNNSTYRYGPNQYFNTIDVLNVAQVEVVRGAGSVLYGSDALGGTVQVLSKTPRFSAEGLHAGGNIHGKWMSAGMEGSGRGEFELSGEKAALRAGFSYRDFGDLLAGGNLGKQIASSYDERAADFKGLFKTGNQSILTLAYNGVFQSEVGRYDQVAQRGYALSQFNPQNRQMGYARWNLAAGRPWMQALNLTASLQHSLEGRESRKEGSPELVEEEDEIHTLGMTAEWIAQPTNHWRIVSGLEYYFDKVGSAAAVTNVETGLRTEKRGLYPDDSRAGNLALFSSHTLRWERWQLNLGARINYFDLRIEDSTFGDTRVQPTALVGNAAVRYTVADGQALIVALNTGFRAPNINDLSSFGSFDFGIEAPSFDLAPEKSLTYELGYKVQQEAWSGALFLYRTQLFNLIDRVRGAFNGSDTYQGEDVYYKQNVAKSFVQGLEANGRWAFNERWDLSASLLYTYGQNTAKEEPMRRIPPLNGRLALTYQSTQGFFAQLENWYAGKQDRLAGGDISDHRIAEGGTPGWTVLNMKLGYQWRTFRLHAGLQNLLNEAYRMHGSGVDGVGRSVWLSGGARF